MMAANLTDKTHFSGWLFFLGQPSVNDLNWLWDNNMGAYVLPPYLLGGEC